MRPWRSGEKLLGWLWRACHWGWAACGGKGVAAGKSAWRMLAALLHPPHCAVCLEATRPGELLCADCMGGIRRIPETCCRRCSRPMVGAAPAAWICVDCQERDLGFECAVAPLKAKGPVLELVHCFKYEGGTYLCELLADWMREGLGDPRLRDPPVDALVPVPLHWWKAGRRGFNQSALLAEALGRRCELPVQQLLRRARHTRTQTRLPRGMRLQNMRGAFVLRGPESRVRGKHLLLVDDVLTTGATLDACAWVLRKAGAASVRALTVARAGR